ncbi:MAG: hypothetical protein ACOCRK_11730, partial [bacterium]
NEAKKYIKKRVKKVLDIIPLDEEARHNMTNDLFSMKENNLLYKYFSAEILLRNWHKIFKKINDLNDEDIQVIIENLVKKDSDGYKYLNLADKADFIQRDALYLGTVKLEISPEHLYNELLKYKPNYSIDEKELLDVNLNYLTSRFYHNPDVVCFSRLFEKIVAAIIINSGFDFKMLEEYNNMEFKRLICYNLDKNNSKRFSSSNQWIKRAKELFNGELSYTRFIELDNVSFPDKKDSIDIEYYLVNKRDSQKGLLTYPWEKGVLLSIEYKGKFEENLNEYMAIISENDRYSVTIFKNNEERNYIDLLNLINILVKHLSIMTHINKIKVNLGKDLSWTGDARIDNSIVINSIKDAIFSIENSQFNKGEFVKNYLREIQNIKSYQELWENNINNFFWFSTILSEIQISNVRYDNFIKGILSLPTKLLQYRSTVTFLNIIYDELLQMIKQETSSDIRGNYFETLCLLERIKTSSDFPYIFQIFLNGLVFVDYNQENSNMDKNEFDIIELIINSNGQAECIIYACSIADDYRNKDIEQLTKLVEHINSKYPDMIIKTKYMIPHNKLINNWNPKIEDAGRNYNLE